MRTLVVLPTYNEAENIDTVLRRVRHVVPDADILVVDDGSPDGTADLAEKVAAQTGRIEVLRRAAKSGLGSAYRAGFRIGLARGYDALVEMDSDLSHDPDALPDLLAAAASGADLVIGSRYVAGGRIPNWPWYRLAISRGGNRFARSMLGLEVQDSTAGFRVYSRDALSAIALDTVKAEGYGFQVEMTYRVHQCRLEIREIPIEFRDREFGTSKMSWRIVFEALVLVTWWAVRDRLGSSRGNRPAVSD
ncbi:MAG TPA: polyprenol monophosphomannose synthase [Acidimicrobiia bacterium]|nr:polyprenol monophosphomannose synthase [Acidimicrobiia bacterium]